MIEALKILKKVNKIKENYKNKSIQVFQISQIQYNNKLVKEYFYKILLWKG